MTTRLPHLLGALGGALLALLAAGSCSERTDSFRLEGSLAGVNQAEFYVYADEGYAPFFDTVTISGGSFSYERRLAEPMVVTLLYPNFSQTLLVAEPGVTLKMDGDASHLAEAEVRGSDENKLLADFRRATAGRPAADVRLAAEDFVRSHPENLAAYAVLKGTFIAAAEPDAATLGELLGVLRRAQPGNAQLEAQAARLDPLLATAVGQQLPDFHTPTLTGDTVGRADFAGRPLLVAFAAAWHGESGGLTRKVRRLQRHYGNRLGTLVVMLDADTVRSRRLLRRDSVGGHVVCLTEGLEADLARRLGLRYVPSAMVVGADGRIASRDVTADDVERRVADAMPAE